MKIRELQKRTGTVMLAALLAFVPACGNSRGQEVEDEQIELIDPVSVAVSCVAAQRRDLYDYSIYSAICCPAVSECVTDEGIRFSTYGSMPGEGVSAGDELIIGDTTDIDKQIKNLKESIEDMESSRADEVEQQQESFNDVKKELDSADHAMSEIMEDEPEDENSPSYAKWYKNYFPAYTRCVYADLAYRRKEEDIRESEELYNLDHAHQQDLLARLYDNRNNSVLKADREGTVVALGYSNNGNYTDFYRSGDWIGRNTVAMALGDMSVKELRCEYISPSTLSRAEEVFAIRDGERMEVEYHPLSSDEYDRLLKKNDKVYGTFTVTDCVEEPEFGDFCSIVVIKNSRKDVLCVPSSAITWQGSDSFVYVFDGNVYSERYIRCGLSDGRYTEVLSGLSDDEMIKAEIKLPSAAKEDVIKKGSIDSSFSASGYLYYPSTKVLNHSVNNGTVYLDELCVHRYEQVSAGQVIARVHVVNDGVDLARAKRELQRLNEQLEQLKKDGEKENKYQIRSMNRQIEKKQKQIDELAAGISLTQIVADRDGIITEITDKEAGDIIQQSETIARLAEENSCFVMVEDADGKLSYGNTVSVSYKDNNGNNKSVDGTVVTANAMTLGKELQSGYSIVKLPVEAVAEMAGSSRNTDGWWSVTRVSVSAKLRSMNNVLLIPKSAVKEDKGATYVMVKDDSGAVRMEAFVAGGSDKSNYWVAYGLSEGTKICWE